MLHNLTDFKMGLPLSVRSPLFIVGPECKTLKLHIAYPASTGRNWMEIMRMIDSWQMTSTKKLVRPSDWVPGERGCYIAHCEQRESGHRHDEKFSMTCRLYGLL